VPRILVAEDNPLVRRFLLRCLQAGGFEAEAVEDGVQAIVALRRGGWDAVVTDYAMPVASGLEVIAAARRIDPTLPCVVVTAVNDLEPATQAMLSGAAGFVPKPCKPDHLLAVVRSALEPRRVAAQATRTQLRGPMLQEFAMILANTLEAKDASTHLHCERLVEYATALAAHLGLPRTAMETVRLGACLHDIGKIAIPDSLLRKQRGLDEAEWAVLRRHSEIGAAILHDVDGWHAVRRIVLHHHERFDGGGYPDGLRGARIPVGARIVCAVDAWDVMLSGRVYSPPRSPEEAVAELRRMRGLQFDPDVVDAFLDLVEDGDGLVGVVGRETGRMEPAYPRPAA
jgi:putative two-component system response regulator